MKPDAYDIKAKIGVVFQDVAVFEELTVYDNIDYFCGLYIKDKKTRKQYIEEAIDLVGLAANTPLVLFPNKIPKNQAEESHMNTKIKYKIRSNDSFGSVEILWMKVGKNPIQNTIIEEIDIFDKETSKVLAEILSTA